MPSHVLEGVKQMANLTGSLSAHELSPRLFPVFATSIFILRRRTVVCAESVLRESTARGRIVVALRRWSLKAPKGASARHFPLERVTRGNECSSPQDVDADVFEVRFAQAQEGTSGKRRTYD